MTLSEGHPTNNQYERNQKGNTKFLIERFTRLSDDSIAYEFTVDDPQAYTDKITGIIPLTKVDGLLYEYACHEGNYGLLNILRGARAEEARATESAR